MSDDLSTRILAAAILSIWTSLYGYLIYDAIKFGREMDARGKQMRFRK